MLTTTGYNFEGYIITDYIKVITEAIVLGTGFASTLSASFADFTGTRSESYANKLQQGKDMAMKNLEIQARQLGANGIIGIDIDYTTFANDVMGIIITGTAVRLGKEKKTVDNIIYSFPVCSYNRKLPFNISTFTLSHNLYTNTFVGNLEIRNYLKDYSVTAIVADVNMEEIFGDRHTIPNVVFIFSRDKEKEIHTSKFTRIQITDVDMSIVKKIYISPTKFIVNDNNKVIQIDKNFNVDNNAITNDEILGIRKIQGQDAVCNFEMHENTWTCYCGAINKLDSDICNRCGRHVNVFKKDGIYIRNAQELNKEKLLNEIKNKENAKQIHEFLLELNIPSFSPVIEEIGKLAKSERVYGNMKDSAIQKIYKLME